MNNLYCDFSNETSIYYEYYFALYSFTIDCGFINFESILCKFMYIYVLSHIFSISECFVSDIYCRKCGLKLIFNVFIKLYFTDASISEIGFACFAREKCEYARARCVGVYFDF